MDQYTSDKENALQALLSENNYLKLVIEAMPGWVYWKDKNGKYLGCNLLVAKMAGLEEVKDIIGKSETELPWRGRAADIQHMDHEVMHTGRLLEIEESIQLADGKVVMLSTTKAPLRDQQKNIIGMIGISIDITEKMAREEALYTVSKQFDDALSASTNRISKIAYDISNKL